MVQKYHAKFTGRTKGAIGIFHACQSFTEGTDETAAALALYEDYDHISQLTLTPLVLRYVATYYNLKGQVRQLMTAAQGQYTYSTPEAAQHWIDAVVIPGTNSARTLESVYGSDPQFEVRPCWCWPGHFDPIGVYFDCDTPAAVKD